MCISSTIIDYLIKLLCWADFNFSTKYNVIIEKKDVWQSNSSIHLDYLPQIATNQVYVRYLCSVKIRSKIAQLNLSIWTIYILFIFFDDLPIAGHVYDSKLITHPFVFKSISHKPNIYTKPLWCIYIVRVFLALGKYIFLARRIYESEKEAHTWRKMWPSRATIYKYICICMHTMRCQRSFVQLEHTTTNVIRAKKRSGLADAIMMCFPIHKALPFGNNI